MTYIPSDFANARAKASKGDSRPFGVLLDAARDERLGAAADLHRSKAEDPDYVARGRSDHHRNRADEIEGKITKPPTACAPAPAVRIASTSRPAVHRRGHCRVRSARSRSSGSRSDPDLADPDPAARRGLTCSA